MKLPSCQPDDGRKLKNPNIIFTTCNYKAPGEFLRWSGPAIAIETDGEKQTQSEGY